LVVTAAIGVLTGAMFLFEYALVVVVMVMVALAIVAALITAVKGLTS